MDQIINIITALSGMYVITYLIDSLFETPKDLKTLKLMVLEMQIIMTVGGMILGLTILMTP